MADHQLQASLNLNTQKARQEVQKLAQDTKAALNPASPAFQKEQKAVEGILANINSVLARQKDLAASGGATAEEYAALDRELVKAASQLQKLNTDTKTQNQLLKEQLELQKSIQAASVPKASGSKEDSFGYGAGTGLSTVFRKAGIPVVETGLRPVLQNFLGGKGAGAAEGAAAEGVSGAAVGALAVTGGGLAAAAAVKTVVDELSKAGQAAEELSKSFSDAGGKLDRVRDSAERLQLAEDKQALSKGGAAYQTFTNDVKANVTDAWTSITNAIGDTIDKIGYTLADPAKRKEIDKARQESELSAGKLVGEPAERDQKLRTQRVEMERDIAQQREAFETQIANRRRDLALEEKEFEVNQARKVADEKKKAARETQDYNFERAKTVADVEFKASEKKYQIDQQAKRRDFGLKQSDERVDFKNKQGDEALAHKNSMGDKAADFARQNANRAQDAQMRQEEIGLKGGDAIDYVLAGRQAQVEQQRAAAEYSTEAGREDRDFKIKQGQESRDFGLKQDHEKRDFGNSQKDELEKHAIDLQTHDIQLKQQLYELDLKHARAVEDSATALKRLAEDADFARQKFKNQKTDIDRDEKVGLRGLNQQAEKSRREQGYAEDDNASTINPFVAAQMAQKGDTSALDGINRKRARQGLKPFTMQDLLDQLPQNKTEPVAKPTDNQNYQGAGGDHYDNRDYDSSSETGAYVNKDHIGQVHAGEYIINPQRKDNLSLLMAASKEMSDNGHFDFSADTVGWRKSQQAMIGKIFNSVGSDTGEADSGGDSGANTLFGPAQARQFAQQQAQTQQNNNITNQFQFGDIHASGSGGNDMGSFIQQALIDRGRPLMQQIANDAINQYHQQQMASGVR